MCFMCEATGTYDPSRHFQEGLVPTALPDSAVITEGSDAPSTTGTPYTLSAGDRFNGSISYGGDFDVVRIALVEGETYTFTLTGGSLNDSVLALYSSGTQRLDYSIDAGSGQTATITYTALYTGTYYLSAQGYYSSDVGSYAIATSGVPKPAPTNGSLDQLARYLTDGYWQDTGRSARSFDTSGSNQITVDITKLTAEGQQLARWAFEIWESAIDVNFVETGLGSGSRIDFDDVSAGAFANSVVFGDTISRSWINVSTDWLTQAGTKIGTYSLQTFVHEIGHALGLGHQGSYNGAATYGYGTDETFTNDSWQMSVMSYFSQNNNHTTDASFGFVSSLMLADILAGQTLYGASTATNGNTTWGANTNLSGYWATLFGELFDGVDSADVANNAQVFTIYDNGGNDTFDLSSSTFNNRIDMNDETFSDLNGGTKNLAIARGTIIENFIGGSGADTVQGNEAANNIAGGNGNDSLLAGMGNDTLLGGDGSDRMFGGLNADRLEGGDGKDVLRGDAGYDMLVGGSGADILHGGNGNDSAFGGMGQDRFWGGNGNDSFVGGNGNDKAFGQGGDDILQGGNGADSLTGGNGFDTLTGGVGNDLLSGGGNGDTFIFQSAHGNDTITDFNEGNDLEKIDLSAIAGVSDINDLLTNHILSSAGGNVVIDTGAGTITLQGVNLAHLDANDFLF
ncbi:serralysin [Shimia isoporae]|uniref:Serralysin n=1 Tax=Shimia isoporae TaxID=647720 RepID=A0A4R1N8J9_9RHOB|nr:M10 family metallopeptidase C-terminal domain-containing protein [Shimia isoporae]TCK99870.1 serralysin [Shimia isoporae]